MSSLDSEPRLILCDLCEESERLLHDTREFGAVGFLSSLHVLCTCIGVRYAPQN